MGRLPAPMDVASVLVVIGLSLAGCGEPEMRGAETIAADTTGLPDGAVEEGVASALYVLDCGHIEVSDMGIFAADGRLDGQRGSLANPCFLVRHPKGDLLWDLGLPARLIETGPLEQIPYTVSLDRTLGEQLSAIGVKPGEIEYVALSHGHFDQTGQPEAAAGATLLLPEAERAFMEGGGMAAPLDHLKGLTVETVEANHDVFGDGAIRMISLPGHTPGHSGLLVNLREQGPVFIAGDLYVSREARKNRSVPTFNTDADATQTSMDRFEALAEATQALVILPREEDDIGALPQLPAALR